MARTQLTGREIRDESVQRDDLDIVTPGQAVITKIIAGTNISIFSSGIDIGTGEVTVNATSTGIAPNPPIIPATKTKITYDAKGLVTAGADITKADVGLSNVTNDSQLKRSAGDFGTFPIKLTPVDADRVLIEDSEDSFIKKALPMTSLPKNFGTQYINAASLEESSNSTTTYVSKLLMTTPSFPAGTYMISWYAEVRSGTSNRFGDTQIRVDGTQVAINTPYITFNDPLISYPCSGIINYTFATAGIKNIEMRFRRNPNSSSTTWYIRNATFMMFRVS